MSSGALLGTSSTTICVPLDCSKAASFASSASRCEASRVPVWSMTRAVSAGTGNTSCAEAGHPSASSQQASISRSMRIGATSRQPRLTSLPVRPCRS